MKEDFKIEETDLDHNRNTYHFKQDKIHRTWKKIGKKGECFYSLSEFDGNHHEYSAFGANSEKNIRGFLINGVLGSVLYFGFDGSNFLKILGVLFFILASLAILRLITRMTTTHWVAFSNHKGEGIIHFRVEGLKNISKEQLISEISEYIKNHNQAGMETP